ncbi:hypothetical protein [Streptomyces sp. NPDC056132]|uniref:hypothetical protein n=1 Tax=Streptomyces sp. NPDC056132 TaxID=3345722 RepID=UPI0035DBFAD0
MTNDIPRNEATGERLCEQCHEKPVPPSLGTKPRIYCGRNCRQRAYESRKKGDAILAAVNTALAREAKSRDNAAHLPEVPGQVRGHDPAKSRDDAGNDKAKSRDVPGGETQLSLEIPEPAEVEAEHPAEDDAAAREAARREASAKKDALWAAMGKAIKL